MQRALLKRQVAGDRSGLGHALYVANPMTGVIDGFQKPLMRGKSPVWAIKASSAPLLAMVLPTGWLLFNRAGTFLADVL